MGAQWLTLAQIMADNGELRLARTAAALYVEAGGRSASTLSHQAALFAHIGAWDEASAVLDELAPDQPDLATHAQMRGVVALHLGDTDTAREQLERTVAARPGAGAAWLSLASMVDFAQEPELARRLIEAAPAADGTTDDRAGYFYALGKAHADRGLHEDAFAAIAQGAGIAKAAFPYRPERDRGMALSAVEGYDASGIASLAGKQTEPTARTIFIVGLPRSGTSLLQQILTSHSAVSDGAETTRLSLFAKDVRGLAYPELHRYVTDGRAPEAARLWRHWMDERFPRPGRVVDKTTNTSRLLGLAAALLPEAPLIWLSREPLDCAWSCFRTYFGPSQPWSYDLQDIAHHFRLERDLMERWSEILGDRLLAVPYESLVSDPARWIPRILAHCGLPEEPQVFAPHENPLTVSTASVMQVRRPINLAGIGAAEPYRELLEPFVAAFGT